MATAVETIKNFMSVLKNYSQDSGEVGRIALDDAIRKTTIFPDLKTAVHELENKLLDTETYPDTDTRLREATGMILGEADTGAITGSNAGGSTVKNPQDIVPEDGDMSTATLPEPGSTTPITYTGEDGNSFTFYVKWPDSFSTVISCVGLNPDSPNFDSEELLCILDKNNYVDLNNFDDNDNYSKFYAEDTDTTLTIGTMKSGMQTILKGLNTWWLREAAKLDYDSLGLALDGQTIEIGFVAGGDYDSAGAVTFQTRTDYKPNDKIYITINIRNYAEIDSTDPNGNIGDRRNYLDRTIAHEMVHAIMIATGTLKKDMPQFFTEGIADLVQGDDDYRSRETRLIRELVNNDSEALTKGFSFAEGTGSSYSYPAGDMFLRFLAKQNLNTTAIIGDPSQAQTFDYNGNNEVISNYTSDDAINYNAAFTQVKTPTSFDFSSNYDDFNVEAQDGNQLILRDVRGKLMTFNTAAGNVYAYMAENAEEVDGTVLNNYEIIFGGSYANNILRAGNFGSQLWGGSGGNDELFGGAGQDNFIYNFADGNDTIYNAENQDTISLRGMELEQITSAQINDNGVSLQFTDGGSLNVNGQPLIFSVENKNYRADYQTKTWSET